MKTLAESMREAWSERARAAAQIIAAYDQAPALVKREAAAAAVADYRRAVAEVGRWTA